MTWETSMWLTPWIWWWGHHLCHSRHLLATQCCHHVWLIIVTMISYLCSIDLYNESILSLLHSLQLPWTSPGSNHGLVLQTLPATERLPSFSFRRQGPTVGLVSAQFSIGTLLGARDTCHVWQLPVGVALGTQSLMWDRTSTKWLMAELDFPDFIPNVLLIQ